MGKKSLHKCKSGKDFLAYAQQQHADVYPGKGSHFHVETPKGKVTVPVHTNKDLGKGLATKIRKAFIALGLGALLLFIHLLI